MPVQRPNVAVSARLCILPDGFLFGGVWTLAITIVAGQSPFALIARSNQTNSRGASSRSRSSRLGLGQISTVLPESFGQPEKHEECAVEPDQVGVRDAAEAIANVAPRHRGSIPVAAVGSTKIRVNGAQTGFAVSGLSVTEAVASKRSSWTITTGLGFPVWAPRTAAT